MRPRPAVPWPSAMRPSTAGRSCRWTSSVATAHELPAQCRPRARRRGAKGREAGRATDVCRLRDGVGRRCRRLPGRRAFRAAEERRAVRLRLRARSANLRRELARRAAAARLRSRLGLPPRFLPRDRGDLLPALLSCDAKTRVRPRGDRLELALQLPPGSQPVELERAVIDRAEHSAIRLAQVCAVPEPALEGERLDVLERRAEIALPELKLA